MSGAKCLSLALTATIAVAACADEQVATGLKVPSEAFLAKPVGGMAALASGYQAVAFPVNNTGKNGVSIWLKNTADYAATVSMMSTLNAGTAPCVANNTRVPAARLLQMLSDASKARNTFHGRVALTSLGATNSVHAAAVWWVDPAAPDTGFRVTIGTLAPNQAPPNGVYPKVEQLASNLYRYTGGTVGVGMTYNNTQHTNLVCPNLDTVDLTFPP